MFICQEMKVGVKRGQGKAADPDRQTNWARDGEKFAKQREQTSPARKQYAFDRCKARLSYLSTVRSVFFRIIDFAPFSPKKATGFADEGIRKYAKCSVRYS